MVSAIAASTADRNCGSWGSFPATMCGATTDRMKASTPASARDSVVARGVEGSRGFVPRSRSRSAPVSSSGAPAETGPESAGAGEGCAAADLSSSAAAPNVDGF